MKRTLSLVLAFAMIFSMMATGLVSQAAFKDVPNGFWAQSSIDYMSSYGVINGYTDGTFKPNNSVTKAEFVKMMNYTFGLSKSSYAYYSDVTTSDWFYNEISKAAANGYLTTTGNYVYPNKALPRQEAAAMLARYLDLDVTSSYSSFSDYNQISPEYRSYVMAASAAGIFNGYPDNSFKPNGTITRAEALTVLHRIVGSFVGANSGVISSANATVNKPGASVSNANIMGDFYITEGAEGGVITLQNCTVYGDLIVKAGVTLNLINCTISNIVTAADSNVIINASGTTTVAKTTLKTAATLTNTTTGDNNGFTVVDTAVTAGQTNTFKGKFKTINVTTASSTVSLPADTTVKNLNILASASNTKVVGSGIIEKLTINASGANIETAPKSYEIKSGLSAIIAGVSRTGTGTGSGSYPKFYIVDNGIEIKNLTTASGTTYFMVVAANATAPTVEQIKNSATYYGTVYKRGSFYTNANAENSANTGALSMNTSYDIYTYVEYSYNNVSNIEKETVYVTTAPSFVSGYPIIGSDINSNGSVFSKEIRVRATAATTAYVLAVPYNTTAPTTSQVYDAVTGTGKYLTSSMVFTIAGVNSYGDTTITLTGLNRNTSYNYYVVLGNNASVPVLSGNINSNVTNSGMAYGYPKLVSYNPALNSGMLTLKAVTTGTAYFKPIFVGSPLPTASDIRYYSYTNPSSKWSCGTSETGYNAAPGMGMEYAMVFVADNGMEYTPVRVSMTNNTNTFFAPGFPNITAITPTGSYYKTASIAVNTTVTGTAYFKLVGVNETTNSYAIEAANNAFPINYVGYPQTYNMTNILYNAEVYTHRIAAVFKNINGTYGDVVYMPLTVATAPTVTYEVASKDGTLANLDSAITVTYNQAMYYNGIQVTANTTRYMLNQMFKVKEGTNSYSDLNIKAAYNAGVTTITIKSFSGLWVADKAHTLTASNIKTIANAIAVPQTFAFKTVEDSKIDFTVKNADGTLVTGTNGIYNVKPGAVSVKMDGPAKTEMKYTIDGAAAVTFTGTTTIDVLMAIGDTKVIKAYIKTGNDFSEAYTITLKNTDTVGIAFTVDGAPATGTVEVTGNVAHKVAFAASNRADVRYNFDNGATWTYASSADVTLKVGESKEIYVQYKTKDGTFSASAKLILKNIDEAPVSVDFTVDGTSATGTVEVTANVAHNVAFAASNGAKVRYNFDNSATWTDGSSASVTLADDESKTIYVQYLTKGGAYSASATLTLKNTKVEKIVPVVTAPGGGAVTGNNGVYEVPAGTVKVSFTSSDASALMYKIEDVKGKAGRAAPADYTDYTAAGINFDLALGGRKQISVIHLLNPQGDWSEPTVLIINNTAASTANKVIYNVAGSTAVVDGVYTVPAGDSVVTLTAPNNADIKYSLDNKTWAEYSKALTLNVKPGESAVLYTKQRIAVGKDAFSDAGMITLKNEIAAPVLTEDGVEITSTKVINNTATFTIGTLPTIDTANFVYKHEIVTGTSGASVTLKNTDVKFEFTGDAKEMTVNFWIEKSDNSAIKSAKTTYIMKLNDATLTAPVISDANGKALPETTATTLNLNDTITINAENGSTTLFALNTTSGISWPTSMGGSAISGFEKCTTYPSEFILDNATYCGTKNYMYAKSFISENDKITQESNETAAILVINPSAPRLSVQSENGAIAVDVIQDKGIAHGYIYTTDGKAPTIDNTKANVADKVTYGNRVADMTEAMAAPDFTKVNEVTYTVVNYVIYDNNYYISPVTTFNYRNLAAPTVTGTANGTAIVSGTTEGNVNKVVISADAAVTSYTFADTDVFTLADPRFEGKDVTYQYKTDGGWKYITGNTVKMSDIFGTSAIELAGLKDREKDLTVSFRTVDSRTGFNITSAAKDKEVDTTDVVFTLFAKPQAAIDQMYIVNTRFTKPTEKAFTVYEIATDGYTPVDSTNWAALASQSAYGINEYKYALKLADNTYGAAQDTVKNTIYFNQENALGATAIVPDTTGSASKSFTIQMWTEKYGVKSEIIENTVTLVIQKEVGLVGVEVQGNYTKADNVFTKNSNIAGKNELTYPIATEDKIVLSQQFFTDAEVTYYYSIDGQGTWNKVTGNTVSISEIYNKAKGTTTVDLTDPNFVEQVIVFKAVNNLYDENDGLSYTDKLKWERTVAAPYRAYIVADKPVYDYGATATINAKMATGSDAALLPTAYEYQYTIKGTGVDITSAWISDFTQDRGAFNGATNIPVPTDNPGVYTVNLTIRDKALNIKNETTAIEVKITVKAPAATAIANFVANGVTYAAGSVYTYKESDKVAVTTECSGDTDVSYRVVANGDSDYTNPTKDSGELFAIASGAKIADVINEATTTMGNSGNAIVFKNVKIISIVGDQITVSAIIPVSSTVTMKAPASMQTSFSTTGASDQSTGSDYLSYTGNVSVALPQLNDSNLRYVIVSTGSPSGASVSGNTVTWHISVGTSSNPYTTSENFVIQIQYKSNASIVNTFNCTASTTFYNQNYD